MKYSATPRFIGGTSYVSELFPLESEESARRE
jgi:hypothetical protein